MEARQGRPDWIGPGMALFPLRLFLGGTFVYAGIQKLSDPGFFHSGAPTYIGTQLHGFASGTPGGFILRTFAIPHPILAGVGVAIFEMFIGILAVAGLRTRLAASAGLGLSLLLFLTASWHTTPYFLGPDIVFAFAWLPFVLAGAEGQPALDHSAAAGAIRARGTRIGLPRLGVEPASSSQRLRPQSPGDVGEPFLTRRALVAEAGAAALLLAGIASLAKGSYRGVSTSAPQQLKAGGTPSPGGGVGPSQGAASGGSNAARLPANAVKLGPSSRLGSGQAASYGDPADGSADILIRASDGSLTAFSAICTHAGCQVGYQGGEIVCPCHGAVYNAQTGQVEAGPAPQALAQKHVIEQGGQIYAVPS